MMIERISGWFRPGSWRVRTAVAAAALGCLAGTATASAAPPNTHLSILAGNGTGGAPTPGPAISSPLNRPRGVAVDSATGDLYIADYHNSEIERVTPEGTLSIFAGAGGYGAPTPGRATRSHLGNPTGLAVDPATGNVYIADPFNNEVEKVTPRGILSIVAGTGSPGAPTPGSAIHSKLNEPYGLAVNPTTGDLYIADYDNSEIERVTAKGILSVIAGTGVAGAPTPGPATSSALRNPSGVAVNPTTGDVYIADPFNNEVDQITARGILSIIAGNGTPGAPTPGVAATSELNLPHAVAVNPATGDLYIADYSNSEIDQITSQGTLSIVAGTGVAGTPTPGPAAKSALDQPLGVAVDEVTGDLYIADTTNNEVERVGPTCPNVAGSLIGSHLGRVSLGMTRAGARKALPIYTVTHNQADLFCLSSGPGIIAGYPSAGLLRTVSARQRGRLRSRVVVALTANPHYALDHITAGTQVSRVSRRLKHAQRFRIGGSIWYVLPGSKATGVLKVQHGTVEEVGIANRTLTATIAGQRRLLTGF